MLILFTNCTPQRRLSNLIQKHPYLMNRDSTLIKDSILIKGKHVTTTFDTTINVYHYRDNGIDIDFEKRKGKYTISANTRDTLFNRNYYNYVNNYHTVTHVTFKEKLEYGLIVMGIISFLILIVFVLIKLIK